MSDNRTLAFDEWNALGEKLFGNDRLSWKFRCPGCGNIQTPQELEAAGTVPDQAYFSCIGRYDGHIDTAFWDKKQPCNYTLGGLFKLEHVTILTPDGKEHAAFPFASD